MLGLISMLFRFLIACIFRKGELDVMKTTFSPTKFLVSVLLFVYLTFSFYGFYKLSIMFGKVERACPGIIGELKQYKSRDIHDQIYVCAKALQEE